MFPFQEVFGFVPSPPLPRVPLIKLEPASVYSSPSQTSSPTLSETNCASTHIHVLQISCQDIAITCQKVTNSLCTPWSMHFQEVCVCICVCCEHNGRSTDSKL